jgi:FkbM family methyltransferase
MFRKALKKLLFLIFPELLFERKNIYKSYSQVGEDRILSFLFSDKKINVINYLDIGTNLPVISNNTYLFYTRGSHGVCVEADKSLIPLIKKFRPKDRIINAGVSINQIETHADFYIFDVKGLSTFDKDEAIRRESYGTYKILEIDRVQLIDINSLINQNFTTYPDFLSIDIEGLDLDVLKSLNFDLYPIPVICVETCLYSENHIRQKDNSISKILIEQGYEVYADTYVNTIFVEKKWFYNLK